MAESEGSSRVWGFIASHWVSWVIEIVILSTIAYFTISETRKTAEQTREMLAKYDAAITKYATEKTAAIDDAFAEGKEAVKEKASKLSVDGAKAWLSNLRSGDDEEESEDSEDDN